MGTLAVKRRAVLARWLACGCRAGLTAMRLFPDSCRLSGCRVVRGPAGAPGAASRRGRTSWTPGSGRRSSEARKRGSRRGWRGWGSLVSPGCVAEWSHMHPSGTCRGGGCHDRVIRGPGCSVRSSSAARPAHAVLRAYPGLGDPSRLVTRIPCLGADVVVACTSAVRSASVSRCQARVRSLRAIAVVAIFLPRRRAIAV
jgi:hypothetical protein